MTQVQVEASVDRSPSGGNGRKSAGHVIVDSLDKTFALIHLVVEQRTKAY